MSFSNDRRVLISTAALAVSATLLAATQASAAILTYDANTTPPVNDGTGVWDTATTNWFDGANDVVWANTTADTAIFGAGGTIANAAAGTVTVGTVNAGTIQFNPTVTTGYLLTGGTITLGSGITSTTTLTTNVTSVIAGSNGLAFFGTGTATVSLNGANTYSGITTTGTLGRLQANNVAALGASAGATATTLGTDYTSVGTNGTVVVTTSTNEAFLINGSGQGNAGALRINNAPTLSSLIRLGSNALILNNGGGAATINGNIENVTFALTLNTFGSLIANPFTVNGDISGTGNVSISSSGSPVLFNGTKTYTGQTFIGSATANSATFGGTGTLASPTLTVNAGGTITGGSSGTVGTLGLNNTVLSGTDLVDLTVTGSDLLAITGNLNLSTATDVLKIQGTSGLASYTLITFTGTLTGTFDSVVGLPAGYTLNYNANSITLDNPSLVPEPTAIAAISILGGVALRRRRSM